jgi:glycine cleavage system H protein|tara:strand:- start:2734 stop:3252 length:519 start_codon:yes stop_codon:yes gene_type:complete
MKKTAFCSNFGGTHCLKVNWNDEMGNRSIGGFIKYRRFDKSETDRMSEIPEGQYYTKEHEWLRVEGDEIIIGITDYAQHALTDIVYIELPDEGEVLTDMEEFAIVESVKSASPIFAPFAGKITAVNDALEDAPELMNSDPYGEGWIVRMSLEDPSAVSSLMDVAAYKAEIGE